MAGVRHSPPLFEPTSSAILLWSFDVTVRSADSVDPLWGRSRCHSFDLGGLIPRNLLRPGCVPLTPDAKLSGLARRARPLHGFHVLRRAGSAAAPGYSSWPRP